MKWIFILAFTSNVCFSALAQEYEWVAIAEAQKRINLTGMAVDQQENIYICGMNDKNARFDSADGSSFRIQEGIEDIDYQFLASYDKNGQVRWVQTLVPFSQHGSSIDAVACNIKGDVYIAGTMSNAGRFTSAGGKDSSLAHSGYRNGFVAQYTTDGIFNWVKVHPQFKHLRKIHADANGNVYAYEDHVLRSGMQVWSLSKNGKTLGSREIPDRYFNDVAFNDEGEMYILARDFKGHYFDIIKWKPGSEKDTFYHFDYNQGSDISNSDNGP